MAQKREPYMKFKGYLVENRIQQVEVANLLGMSKASINKKLNGTGSDFSVQDLKKICIKYSISADKFF